jgi:hypothetical protein
MDWDLIIIAAGRIEMQHLISLPSAWRGILKELGEKDLIFLWNLSPCCAALKTSGFLRRTVSTVDAGFHLFTR